VPDNLLITYSRRYGLTPMRRTAMDSVLMGHPDTRTTLTYLGVRLDDMQEAMDRMGRFEDSIRGTA
jgi:hypothetical protein